LDEYVSYESNLLDWIYEEGELDFFTKEDMMNFMKYRLDDSLVKLGQPKYFNVTDEEYSKMKWYEEEMYSTALDDFFAKRPVDYTKHDKSFDSDNLF
jgi:ribonucleoside-diphosphate reductase beta chain